MKKSILLIIGLCFSASTMAMDFQVIHHSDGRIEYTNVKSPLREGEDIIQYIYTYRIDNRTVISDILPEYVDEFTLRKQVCRGCLRKPNLINNTYQIPNRRIKDVPLVNRFAMFNDYINKASEQYNVPVSLIKAVIHTESFANPNALSPKGAAGLMQIMPATGLDLGITEAERFDPEKNIMAGTRYLRKKLDEYNQDYKIALAAYNAGSGAVNRYKGIPPFTETINYIEKVLYLNNKY